jgi:hypothetical protein
MEDRGVQDELRRAERKGGGRIVWREERPDGASMADDKSNRGGRDRATVAGDEPYELSYFARKYGLTMERPRELIAQHGNSRAVLDAAMARLKAGE